MSKPQPENLLDILENEQLAAVTDTFSQNSVVAAGAGSGKTYVLSRRFAWLVCEKNIPAERILTLTFTKKAAAEMYQRIYSTLVHFSKILTGEKKARAEAAIRDFSKTHIQTLDSYCSSIIKPYVHEYGIRPDYTTDVAQVREAIQKLALPFVLKHQDNPALQELVSTHSPQEVADSLFASVITNNSSLTRPIPFTADFEKQTEEVAELWSDYNTDIDKLLKTIKKDVEAYSPKSENMIEKKKDILKLFNDTALVFPKISLPPADNEKQKADVFAYLKNLYAVAAASTYLSQNIKLLRPVFEKFSSLANFVYRWSMLNSLNPLLEDFQEQCASVKRTQGLLTFQDASDLAITVLTENKDMRRAEKNAYDKIMIDEFQDNNELQRDLLYLLSERNDLCSEGIPANDDLVDGKLFFVGDEKQSIYKFRGADVAVFNSLKNDLKKSLSLSMNRRSHPALIAAFNTMFGGYPYPAEVTADYTPGTPDPDLPAIFKKGKPEPYEATYSPALIPSSKFDAAGDPIPCTPRIHAGIILTAADDDSTADKAEEMKNTDSEAIWTAARIKELIKDGRKPGEITILLKTLTHQRQFERYLRQAGVPYASEAVSGFFDDSPINDMIACLRWCVYPADRISYAILLKSPFVRLSDNAVRAVLAGQPISPEEQARLDEALKRLDAFRTELEHLSISEAVTRLWYTMGYQFETRWNATVGLYSELYDFLFELACRADADNRTLSWFADYLQTLAADKGKLDDMDIPLERKDAVHIMTIHKSKGLEFPVVFLCNTAFHANNRGSISPAFFTKENGVSINTGKIPGIRSISSTVKLKNNYFYEKTIEKEKLMERAELDRVLYVGITRAVDELYITGFAKDDQFDLSEDSKQKEQEGTYIPSNIHALLRPLYKYYKDKSDQSPFTLETHPLYTRDEADRLLTARKSARPNTADERKQTAQDAAPLFEAASSPAPYVSQKQTWNPSHLGLSEAATAVLSAGGASGTGGAGSAGGAGAWAVQDGTRPDPTIFTQVDALVQDVPAFTNAHFGTLAHAAIEEAYTHEKLKPTAELAAVLSGEQREKVIALARKLAPSFVESELGRLAQRALWRQNEYDFKMRLPASESTGGKAVTVKGQIDLLFETEEHGEQVIYIVDFKTDSAERPEEHVTQLACYSHAARQMRPYPDGTQKKTRCWLFYLRSGHSVEITSETAKIRLEDLAPLPPQEPPAQPH